MLMLAIVLYIFFRAMSWIWAALHDLFGALLKRNAGLLIEISTGAIHCKSFWVVLFSMRVILQRYIASYIAFAIITASKRLSEASKRY